VLQPEIAKNTKNCYFGGSRPFKVIDVDTPMKLVTSACYQKKQHQTRKQTNNTKQLNNTNTAQIHAEAVYNSGTCD